MPSETKTAPGTVRNVPASSPLPGPPTNGRNDASANGSTPSTDTTNPGWRAVRASPSTTGAIWDTPASAASRATSAPSTPPGPPMTWCVARPVTASPETSKARSALVLARSTATLTATPKATPRMESAVSHGWRVR